MRLPLCLVLTVGTALLTAASPGYTQPPGKTKNPKVAAPAVGRPPTADPPARPAGDLFDRGAVWTGMREILPNPKAEWTLRVTSRSSETFKGEIVLTKGSDNSRYTVSGVAPDAGDGPLVFETNENVNKFRHAFRGNVKGTSATLEIHQVGGKAGQLGTATLALKSRGAGSDPVPAGAIDEKLFALYAVEELAREFRAGDSMGKVNQTNVTTAVARRLAELSEIAAYQNGVVSGFRRHISKSGDAEVIAVVEGYERHLGNVRAGLTGLDNSLLLLKAQIQEARGNAAAGTLLAGVASGFRAIERGADSDQAFAAGLAAMLAASAREEAKAKKADIALAEQLTAAKKAFEDGFVAKLDGWDKEFETKIRASRWADGEFAFSHPAAKPAPPARNPFAIAAHASAALRNEAASSAELLKQSDVCIGAADMVPVDPAFNPFRSTLLGVAGRLINKASEKELGAAPFPSGPKDVTEGSAKAVAIWARYMRAEQDVYKRTYQVVHSVAMAHVYAGDAHKAYDAVWEFIGDPGSYRPLKGATGRVLRPTEVLSTLKGPPGFWFDMGRICSVSGHPALALSCLRKADSRGFRDRAAALRCQDLDVVRTHESTSAGFGALFGR